MSGDADGIEKAILDSVIEKVTEDVMAKLTQEEANKISVVVIGSDLNNLSLNFKGPEEIVSKIEDEL